MSCERSSRGCGVEGPGFSFFVFVFVSLSWNNFVDEGGEEMD